MISSRPALTIRFYSSPDGQEPVREWLRTLGEVDRRRIGYQIRKLQFGWPIGMPLVRKLTGELWEIRVQMSQGNARIIFTLKDGAAVLLNGFNKKSPKTPLQELGVAHARAARLRQP